MEKPCRIAVVLTALPVECDSVLKLLTEIEEKKHPKGTVYQCGKFVAHADEDPWDVVVVEIGAGNPAAAMETERAISYFDPCIALFVGVAGGLKDVALGDVVAATKVYGYESGKDSDELSARPDVGESSYSLIQLARTVSRSRRWHGRIESVAGEVATPAAFVGPIAAGEKVVASTRSTTALFLKAVYGDAKAVEMEGRGFLKATHANEGVRALIVRGVSDLIDHKQQADAAGSQLVASAAASAFAFEVLANFSTTLPSPAERAGEWVIVLSGKISEANREHVVALVEHLKGLSGDVSITLKRVESGSIKLVFTGTRGGFDRLSNLAEMGALRDVLGHEVLAMEWRGSGIQGYREEFDQFYASVVSDARAGSVDAVGRIVEAAWPYIKRVVSAAALRFPSQVRETDLVMNAIVAMLREPSILESGGSDFLRRTADLIIREAFKQARGGAGGEYSIRYDSGIRGLIDSTLTEAPLPNLPEEAGSLTRAIGILSDQERHAISMHYLEGLSLAEIGETLGCSKIAAAQIVQTAMLKVSAELRDLVDERM